MKAVHNRSRYINHGCRCDECLRAVREYQREYRRKNAVARAADRYRSATYYEAIAVLRDRHPDEFEQILAEIRGAEVAS